ncbi:MAG: tRNA (adenosine(37)-N6)-threonylcarbamoyltransferase complex dimerization subunit type 1 TsaB [Bacteroidia bacterium]|nr:tRNA (adenosine(37)-N6)-threonylcarbamoyltransferase complex dimerization subunit type 1 TsaB [Bacteroidia bacterium]
MTKEPLLLLLETATGVCSVALSRGAEVLAIRTSSTERAHASMLTVYIRELMQETGHALKDLDAVVVSRGPGSYTGLRIGVAVAKGICFTLDKPLIAIDTPLAMASQYLAEHRTVLHADTVLVPVIDARRMEVYGAALNMQLNYLEGIRAEILHPGSFIIDRNSPHVLFGDAAEKCVEVYKGETFVKVDTAFNLSAQGLLQPALPACSRQQFEDIAYFEPYYLKEFVAKVKERG